MPIVSAYISQELFDKINELGKNRSELIKEALIMYCGRSPTDENNELLQKLMTEEQRIEFNCLTHDFLSMLDKLEKRACDHSYVLTWKKNFLQKLRELAQDGFGAENKLEALFSLIQELPFTDDYQKIKELRKKIIALRSE